jgi:hypothetical protein
MPPTTRDFRRLQVQSILKQFDEILILPGECGFHRSMCFIQSSSRMSKEESASETSRVKSRTKKLKIFAGQDGNGCADHAKGPSQFGILNL